RLCGCGRDYVRRLIYLRYGLLQRRREGGDRRWACCPGPYQHSAVLVDREVVDFDQFLFEGFKRLLIQVKLELERAVGHAPAALKHGNRLIENLLKSHRPPSLCRCGVPQTVWELARPFGRMYTA